jgi:Ice-binding-like
MKGGAVNKLTALLFLPALSVCLNAQIILGPTASSFGVLGASTVTNTGATLVVGNVGVSPGNSITGFPPGMITNGSLHLADAVAGQAQIEETAAYNVAAALPCPGGNVLTGINLGGLTLTPGVYCFASSAQLTGTLTLNALGNQNAQFIFQIGSSLTTASASNVAFINLAQPANIFWQVGSSATIGSATTFSGNILALASITLNTGATVAGRLFAQNGAVTLAGNTVGIPGLPGSPPGGLLPTTPAPSSLLLVAIGLVGAGIYQSRKRLFTALSKS